MLSNLNIIPTSDIIDHRKHVAFKNNSTWIFSSAATQHCPFLCFTRKYRWVETTGFILYYNRQFFFPKYHYTLSLWNNLPTDLRNSPSQQMFKNEIRKVYDMPDKPPLYVSTGIRIANIYYMLVYVKNVVASNAIYLDII